MKPYPLSILVAARHRSPRTFWMTSVALGLSAVMPVAGLVERAESAIVRSLAGVLEHRVEADAISANETPAGIIILGGGLERARAGTEIANRNPHIPLILSGAGDEEIDYVQRYIKNPARLTIDPRPTNTFENGFFSRDLAQPKQDQRWVLVTSAIHMPRAVGVFKALGLPVMASPVRDTPYGKPELRASVLHEVAGLLAYWMMGRSSAIFPRRTATKSAAHSPAQTAGHATAHTGTFTAG